MAKAKQKKTKSAVDTAEVFELLDKHDVRAMQEAIEELASCECTSEG
jgi:hypothetical protein